LRTSSPLLFYRLYDFRKAIAASLVKLAFIMYLWIPLSLLSLSAHAASIDRLARFDKRAVPAAQIRAELGPQLSAEAVIVDAENGDLERATLRWQEYTKPTFVSAVEVATVEDVAKTVGLLIAVGSASKLTVPCR
jgi:hypothetical protein